MGLGLRSALRRSLKFCDDLDYHLVRKARATAILKDVAASKGRLAPSIVKRCDEWATQVFGRKYYAPWLYVYAAVAGEFREGWVPENFYEFFVFEHACGPYFPTAELNPLSALIFRSDSFPSLAGYANGAFFDAGFAFVPPEEVADILFQENEKVVFKLDGSGQGRGVFVFTRASFDPGEVRRLGNGVFQGFIRQHEFFDQFASDAVATIRITTCMDDRGAVTPRASNLRLGGGSETHVISTTQTRIPISLADGALRDVGYTPRWIEVEAHPASGVRFSGKTVPSFRSCLDLAVEMHRKVPFVRCVGWDLAVERTGRPRIMEWNIGYNGIAFAEATEGPCFADLGWERYRPTGRDWTRPLF